MYCDQLALVLLAACCFGAASVLAEDRANFYVNCDGNVEIEAPAGKITTPTPRISFSALSTLKRGGGTNCNFLSSPLYYSGSVLARCVSNVLQQIRCPS